MIEKNLVYRKSAKGTEAIATRQHGQGLAPKQRSLLIMVDGKRTGEELERVAQALGDPAEMLGQLLDAGYMEPTGAAGAPQAPAGHPASAPAPLAGAAPTMTLAEAKRFASRRLTDLLGPNAEDLCLRIEAARNVHDFQVAVSKAEGMLRQFVSAGTAAAFAAEIHSHMPAG
ncbi:MAG: hypothetical protein ACAH21_03430 [Ramlibacter sp.]|nr:hypothetical protein [Ramlibacter sp.]